MNDKELYNYIHNKLYTNGKSIINKPKQIKLPNGKTIKAYVNSKNYIHCFCVSNIKELAGNKIEITYDHFRFTGKKELVMKNGWDIRYFTIREARQELLSWEIELNKTESGLKENEYYYSPTNETKTLYQIGFEHIIEHEDFLPGDCTKQEIIDIGRSITQDYQEHYDLVKEREVI